MTAKTERDMSTGIFTLHIEAFAVFEFVLVTIGRGQEAKHTIAGRDAHAGYLDGFPREAAPGNDGWPESQNLLDCSRNEIRIFSQLRPRALLLQQREYGIG